jgi:alpha-amylase/alpha-mannosidase (GH57 family)
MASPAAVPNQRYICIHGHFYQPPRENPWLETVETQDSAAPYHDWNERVTAECYAPNGAARIVNAENHIIRILNNYGRMSFNFGPTLLSWLEVNAGRVYRMILDADANSQKRFGGHGSAVAQVYNHVILPLASTRDRITQIRWGIADFERRFQRKPEGMWLPETAVDTESLELLAAEGIKFVILAPHQCARIRPLSDGHEVQMTFEHADYPKEEGWIETPNASVDTTCPYVVRLKDDRSIAVFFYDGPTSRAIAFERLLNDGHTFVRRLVAGFSESKQRPQLVHVATDGETYGHHHRHGEMALAWALKRIQDDDEAKLTNYGQFLEKFPAEFEAQIVEDTSWSCSHGIERWRSNCGCNGGHAGWNQQWRAPLRAALDGLRDGVAPLVRARAAELFRDLDAARNAYIDVILDREATDAFFAVHAARELSPGERVDALELMELERNAMLMYTSCGWFFDEISGIETVQVIAYAGRLLHLAEKLFGEKGAALESSFVSALESATSNIAAQGSGALVYNRYVKGERVDLEQVAAHYAISSVFTSYGTTMEMFCYTIRRLAHEVVTSGRGRLLTGQASIRSNLTGEQETVAFAVLHFGDQNITATVKRYGDKPSADAIAAHDKFVREAKVAAIRADFPAVIRAFDRHFPGKSYSIRSLFRDEQRRILGLILKPMLSEVEASLASIYENQASLLHFLSQAGLPRPEALTLAATFAIGAGLRRALESEPIDALQVRNYLELATADQVPLNTPQLSYIADQKMKSAMVELQAEVVNQTEQTSTIENVLLVARTLNELPFDLNLWQAQNIWYDVWRQKNHTNHVKPDAWLRNFQELGALLRISVGELTIDENSHTLAAVQQALA